MKVICFNGHESHGEPKPNWECECGSNIMFSQEPWVEHNGFWTKKLASGIIISKMQDSWGGWEYFSEANGTASMIWSTTLNTFEEMIHIMNDYANP